MKRSPCVEETELGTGGSHAEFTGQYQKREKCSERELRRSVEITECSASACVSVNNLSKEKKPPEIIRRLIYRLIQSCFHQSGKPHNSQGTRRAPRIVFPQHYGKISSTLNTVMIPSSMFKSKTQKHQIVSR